MYAQGQYTCPRLLDYIILVGPKSLQRSSTTQHLPSILNHFPPVDHADFVLPVNTSLFCQPDGVSISVNQKSQQANSPVNVPFVFSLTDKDTSKVRYGICYNFLHSSRLTTSCHSESSPVHSKEFQDDSVLSSLTSLCFLTHHPFFSNFKTLLEFLYRFIHEVNEQFKENEASLDPVWSILSCTNSARDSPGLVQAVNRIESLMLRLLSLPAPSPLHSSTLISFREATPHLNLLFAKADKTRLPYADFPIQLPIQILGSQKVLRILTCLLLEQKVVLESTNYNRLSICVFALIALMYPLQYMFPVIPLLPPCMPNAEHLLLAPTPYLIGLPSSFYATRRVFRMPRDVWLVNLDTHQLEYPEVITDVVEPPEAEVAILQAQIDRALACFENPQTVAQSPLLDAKDGSAYDPAVYVTDQTSLNVALRVSMCLFFNSPNLLRNLCRHTRTMRLLPRPIVAFQFESFLTSRPTPNVFTSMLVKTQAIEYFTESSLVSEGEAYRKIQSENIYDPVLLSGRPIHLDGASLACKSFNLCHWISKSDEPDLNRIMDAFDRACASLTIDQPLDTYSTQSAISEMPAEFNYPMTGENEDSDSEQNTMSLVSSNSEFVSDGHTASDPRADLSTSDTPRPASLLLSRPGKPLPPSLAACYDPQNQQTVLIDASRIENSASSQRSNSTLAHDTSENSVSMSDSRGFSNTSDAESTTAKQWGLPLFPTLFEIVAKKSFDIEKTDTPRRLRQRCESQQYLLQCIKSIRGGSIPNIFVRGRLSDMMTNESNRNLMLARLNKALELEASTSNNLEATQSLPHLEDSRLSSWDEYKALVWLFRQMIAGMEENFSPNFAHTESMMVGPTNKETDRLSVWMSQAHLPSAAALAYSPIYTGGFASAFAMFEVAHTHFYQLAMPRSKRQQVLQSKRNSFPASNTENNTMGHGLDPNTPPPTSASSESSVKEPAEIPFIRPFGRCFPEDLPNAKSSLSRGFRYRRSSLILTDSLTSIKGLNIRLNQLNNFAVNEPLWHKLRVLAVSEAAGTESSSLTPVPTSPEATSVRSPKEVLEFVVDHSVQLKTERNFDRTYIFEDLVSSGQNRSRLWDNLCFWDDVFLDAVTQEREILGLDYKPIELLEHYSASSFAAKRRLELEEDRLLASMLHNMIAFMVALQVDKDLVKRKAHRSLARSHIGLHFSREIENLLDSIDVLHGNDIDLKPLQSRLIPQNSHEVYLKEEPNAVLFIEVAADFLLLRSIFGSIIARWWYSKLMNMSYSPQTQLLCMSVLDNGRCTLYSFSSEKCPDLHQTIITAIERASVVTRHGSLVIDLDGELNVIDTETKAPGKFKVSSDGFSLCINGSYFTLPLKRIKRCCTPNHDTFVIEAYDVDSKAFKTYSFHTDMAQQLMDHFTTSVNHLLETAKKHSTVATSPVEL